jgi:signal transduction histidine kinase
VKSGRSLRSRLFLGAILWTLGLLGVTHVVSFGLMTRYPNLQLIAHSALITLTAILCMVAGLAQIRRGVSPFQKLRGRLAAVRDGSVTRIDGDYPAEVQPLVDDLNALLEHRERAVSGAVAKAGDLAHGLKTPLALLAHEADRADAAGQSELAAAIRQHAGRMQRQIDYHLAHARAAASGATLGTACSIADSAEGLARALRRLHATRGLTIHVDVEPHASVRVQRQDLDEMLGNLLDNACKWAKSAVVVRAFPEAARMMIAVDDDGPGLAADMRAAVLQRGVRADEAAPGSGLGLAIVRDLAELYGGSIVLESSPLGGLRAGLRLPV